MQKFLFACHSISASCVLAPSKHSSCSDAHELLQLHRPTFASPCVPTTSTNPIAKVDSMESRSLVEVTQPRRYKLLEKENKYGLNIYLSKFTDYRLPEQTRGCGNRTGAAVWSMVVGLPFAVSFLIAFLPSWTSRDFSPRHKSYAVVFYLSGAIIFSFCAGGLSRVTLFHPDYAGISSPSSFIVPVSDSEDAKRLMLFVYLVLCFACSYTCFRFADVEFALPSIIEALNTPFVLCVKLVVTLALAAVSTYIRHPGGVGENETHLLGTVYLYYAIRFGLIGFLPSGAPVFFLLTYQVVWSLYTFSQWGDTTPGYLWSPYDALFYPRDAMGVVFMAICSFTVYARDRRFVALTGHAVVFSFYLGAVLLYFRQLGTPKNMTNPEIAVSITLFFFPYFGALFARCERVLPAALQKAKYLRIGYLRRMLDARTMSRPLAMKRCQEMPDDAFGNVAKASKLIIVSHRWLDHYTCDVATSEYPKGLRITTMLEKLDTFFPYSLANFWASLRAKDRPSIWDVTWSFLASIQLGNHDVLIFVDFMCIPQIGKTDAGVLIERTREEEQIFREALVAMGGLFTMYDVMVCPEVPEGVANYESSGWCFCEWESAFLSGKLEKYDTSSSIVYQKRPRFDKVFDDSVADEYMKYFANELKQKLFRVPCDAKIVRDIVEGKVLYRMLIDAIETQKVDIVERSLKELSDRGLLSIVINSPVDETTGNTLLHISVRLPSHEIDRLLITFGARVDVRNHLGDTPFELFMIPRCWEHAYWE